MINSVVTLKIEESLPPSPKKRWKVWLKVLMALLLLGFLFFASGLKETFASLKNVPVSTVGLGVLLLLAAQWLSAWRWRLLAKPMGIDGASTAVFYRWYLAGMFASLCLPSSVGGDVMKAYGLAQQANSQKRAAFLAVFADRVVGFSVLILMLEVARWLYFAALTPMPKAALYLSDAMALGVVTFWLLWWCVPFAKTKVPQQLGLRNFVEKMESALAGISLPALRKPSYVLTPFLISIVSHGLMLWMHCLLAEALHLPALAPVVLFMVYGLSSVMAVLPLTLNGIGLREGTYVALLLPFTVAKADGFALGLLVLLIACIVSLLGGVAWLAPWRFLDNVLGRFKQTS